MFKRSNIFYVCLKDFKSLFAIVDMVGVFVGFFKLLQRKYDIYGSEQLEMLSSSECFYNTIDLYIYIYTPPRNFV